MAILHTDIDALIDDVIDREGGFVDHEADLGGPTRWGITQAVARANGYGGAVQQLPRATAAGIYRKLYWTAPGFDLVSVRFPELGGELFDIGINMGPKIAASFLQRCLNVFNAQGTAYRDVLVDGDVGPATMRALDAFQRLRGADGGERLLEAVRSLRGHRFIEISEARPANEAFTYGWFGRMVEMARALWRGRR